MHGGKTQGKVATPHASHLSVPTVNDTLVVRSLHHKSSMDMGIHPQDTAIDYVDHHRLRAETM